MSSETKLFHTTTQSFDDDDNPFIIPREDEVEHRLGVKKQLEEFRYTVGRDEADWVKSRRLEYLENKREELWSQTITYKATILSCMGETWQWFGDMVRESYLNPLLKKIRKMDADIDLWKNPVRPPETGLSEEQIQEARDADCADFVDVVRRDGKRSWALCVFHNDSHPSMCCYEPGRGFYCFACNKGGNAIDLVMELDKVSFQDAVRKILKIV